MVTFTATGNGFVPALTDNVPAGWTVVPGSAVCTPAGAFPSIAGSQLQVLWFGDFTAGTAFSVSYQVTVPAGTDDGTYPFTGELTYYVGGAGPTTEVIAGDQQVMVGTSTPITGITKEVDGAILPGVSITIDGIGSVVSDQNGQYQIMSTATGDYTVIAHKDGYRDVTQTISITGLGPEFAVTCNFQGNYGLIPNAPNMQYALTCINHWLYPSNPDIGLNMQKALAVINAWLYPISE